MGETEKLLGLEPLRLRELEDPFLPPGVGMGERVSELKHLRCVQEAGVRGKEVEAMRIRDLGVCLTCLCSRHLQPCPSAPSQGQTGDSIGS